MILNGFERAPETESNRRVLLRHVGFTIHICALHDVAGRGKLLQTLKTRTACNVLHNPAPTDKPTLKPTLELPRKRCTPSSWESRPDADAAPGAGCGMRCGSRCHARRGMRGRD